MTFARALSLFIVTCLGLAGAAWAHDAPVTLTATPTPASTTLSRSGLASYAAYVVTITNQGSESLKYLQFTASTKVRPGTGKASFVSSSGLPTACAPTGSSGSIQCSIPVPIRRGATLSFTLVFSAPTAGSAIDFSAKLAYGDDAWHCDKSLQASATTTLQAPDPNAVMSYVPAATGATVFTGTGSTPSATRADPWTTTVTIPPGTATTATIQESIDPASCAADLLTCNFSTLTIPGTFQHLVITLRRDVSTIVSDDHDHGGHDKHGQQGDGRKGGDHDGWSRKPNIANAIIYYEHVLGAGLVPVPNCADDPSLPKAGRPCIKLRKAFPTCYPTPLIDQGDWLFEIWAIDNGRYQG